MRKKTTQSTPAAVLNVEDAMKLVEQAQGLLDRAAQKLSPIRHGSDLMQKTFKQREVVHKLWYLLDRAAHGNHLGVPRDRMSLDSEPEVK